MNESGISLDIATVWRNLRLFVERWWCILLLMLRRNACVIEIMVLVLYDDFSADCRPRNALSFSSMYSSFCTIPQDVSTNIIGASAQCNWSWRSCAVVLILQRGTGVWKRHNHNLRPYLDQVLIPKWFWVPVWHCSHFSFSIIQIFLQLPSWHTGSVLVR